MVDTDERWTAVGAAVRERMTALALSQADLVRLSGVSDTTIRLIMRGEAGNYRPALLAKVATALQWEPDTIDRILAGDEPRPLPDSELRKVQADLAALRSEVQAAVALLHEVHAAVAEVLRAPRRTKS